MENFDLMVAQNILDLLNKQKKKQSDLGRFLDLPRQTVNKILAGKRNLLASEFAKIANFFSCKIEDLTRQRKVLKEKVSAQLMGEITKKETNKTFELIFELSDIIVEQQYLNDNKEA
ncbi:MAG: helix-turn-helix transcriptional regulator [Clostridia bacterium]|nr:helix-turn-helix transcriptional regulator [Clostridia bacterium]